MNQSVVRIVVISILVSSSIYAGILIKSQDDGSSVSDVSTDLSGTSNESSWQTHQSTNQFEVQYPPDWHVVADTIDKVERDHRWVSFGKDRFGNHGYDGDLFIYFFEKSQLGIEQRIAQMGNQFSDRLESREQIVVNGVPALRVLVTTASNPTWRYESVIIEQLDSYYVLDNGAVEQEEFEDFYNSFKLL